MPGSDAWRLLQRASGEPLRLGILRPVRGDPAIAPTLGTFQRARAMNIAVFFITGRVPNGAHYVFAADFKPLVRAEIERAGYTIIVSMGDQLSDLAGGHAAKTFLLPNPFYRIP